MKLQELIGKTPMVKLTNFDIPVGVSLYVKLEGQNPGGSVKDRTAFGMVSKAIARGRIRKGDTLIEATSGNTGIALAMIANIFGLNLKLVMPDNSTAERIQTMEAFGAEVILTPAERTIEYSRKLASELSDQYGFYQLNQFTNPDNYGIHFETTGPEIWNDTKGKITHFVSAMGTTGTVMGVSRFLKSKNSDIQIIGTRPSEGSNIPGIRRWSKEFLPKIFDPARLNRTIDITESNAIATTRMLAHKEGVLAGMSSGGALWAALKVARELKEGVVVSVACDRGERYLSSGLFRNERLWKQKQEV